MPISNPRALRPGDVLVRRYRDRLWRCEVAQIGNGLGFRLEDGREFRTPSTAGKAIIGTECNGYVWWHRASDPPAKRGPKPGTHRTPKSVQPIAGITGKPKTVRGIAPVRSSLPTTAVATPVERKPRMVRNIKLSAYQANLKRGETRFWCNTCERNFVARITEPEKCEVGHPAAYPAGRKQELAGSR